MKDHDLKPQSPSTLPTEQSRISALQKNVSVVRQAANGEMP